MAQEPMPLEDWANSQVVDALRIIDCVAPDYAPHLKRRLEDAHNDALEIEQCKAEELDEYNSSFFQILFGDCMAIERKYRAVTEMRWRFEHDAEQRILEVATQMLADVEFERNATVRY